MLEATIHFLVSFFVTPFDVLSSKLPVATSSQVAIGFMALFLALKFGKASRVNAWLLMGFLLAVNLWHLVGL